MDAASFEKALPAVMPRLRALAARLVSHPDETEDVLQDALVRATRAIGGFRGESSLETWLYSITARVAIDHLGARRRFRTQVMVDACNDAGREQLLGIFEDPSVAFDVHEHIAFCFGCVGRTLDPEENAAIVLREVLGLENGPCHQCRTLREVAPEGRRGPALPVFPLPFAERLRLTLDAHTEGTPYALLRDHFSRASTAMNDAGA